MRRSEGIAPATDADGQRRDCARPGSIGSSGSLGVVVAWGHRAGSQVDKGLVLRLPLDDNEGEEPVTEQAVVDPPATGAVILPSWQVPHGYFTRASPFALMNSARPIPCGRPF